MAITTIADYSYLSDVYNSSPLPYPQINIPVSLDAGCTMEIQNYSPFVLQIYSGKTLIESLPPYSWLICNYTDKATANIVSPASLPLAAGAFISTNVMPQKLARLRGDFTLPLAQTVNTPVITPSGSTLAVAGSLNVANVVSATITQAAGTSLSIGTVQSIVENVTTSANVTNTNLNVNPLGNASTAPSYIANISNLPVNNYISVNIDIPIGIYDEVWIGMASQKFTNANWPYQMSIGSGLMALNGFILNPQPDDGSGFNIPELTLSSVNNYNGRYMLWVRRFPSTLLSYFFIALQNISSSEILSDTVDIFFWPRYASATVDNTPTSPVQSQQSYQMTQTALGSFTVSGTSFTGTTAAQYTQTFPTDNLKTMHLMISVTNATGLSSTCQLQIALKSSMTSGGMLYDIGETNTYPTVFSIDGNANVTWDNTVTPQMSSAYPYLTLAIYLNNSSATATTASCNVSITAMVNS